MTIEEMIAAAVEGDEVASTPPTGRIVCIRLADTTVVDGNELARGRVLVPDGWTGTEALTSWWGPAMDELVIEPAEIAAVEIDGNGGRELRNTERDTGTRRGENGQRWIANVIDRLRLRRRQTLRVGVDIDGVITRKDWERDPWRELNGWEVLEPLDPEGLAELRRRTHTHKWEVYAITSRPASPGRTVQHQTRRWLTEHDAYELSPVMNPDGRRARVAAALELHWLIDDTWDNCSTTALETDTRVIWIAPKADWDEHDVGGTPNLEASETLREAIELIDQQRVQR